MIAGTSGGGAAHVADQGKKVVEKDATKKQKKRKKRAAAADGKANEPTPGIIYISRIPGTFSTHMLEYGCGADGHFLRGTMGPAEIRRYFTDFGDVGRMFLRPESEKMRAKRKKAGANVSKLKYIEGWVEFAKKKKAKKTALMLNAHPVGGPLSCKWRDELWNIKYLRGFFWEHLKEEKIFKMQFHQRAVRTELAAAKADTQKYLDNVEKAKRKEKKRERGELQDEEPKKERSIKQKVLQDAEAEVSLGQDLLKSVIPN